MVSFYVVSVVFIAEPNVNMIYCSVDWDHRVHALSVNQNIKYYPQNEQMKS